jgi:ATP-dependent Clp protease ATP-binding subunit ClpC
LDEKIFEKFSESARNVLISSQQIADSMQSPIGSEHILIAMIVNRGTFAHEILREYDVNVDQIKLILSLQPAEEVKVTNGIAEDAQQLLMHATKLAVDHHHITVDAEHLLLGIVSNKKYNAYDVIERIGVNPTHLKKQIESLFDEIAEIDRLVKSDEKTEKKSTKSKQTKPKTPALDYFTVDLTLKALQNELDPVIGRQPEINRAIQILSRRTKNNPVLIGDPGVGKTAIVEGLAQRIVDGNVPTLLSGKRLLSLDLTMMLAGTMYRGQFEDRVKKIMDELRANPDIIIFIDELHTVVGAGSAEGSLDAANILKPALAKGWLRLIGATTHDEYRKHIQKDSAFERRFQIVKVDEPSLEESIAILQGLRSKYEQHHEVEITDAAITAAVKLSHRYITERFLPDKAIDLIDEAAAATRLREEKETALTRLTKKTNRLQHEKDQAVSQENYQKASQLKDQIDMITKELERLKQLEKPTVRPVIDETQIAELVAANTGIPLTNLIDTEKVRYQQLSETVSKFIIGQDEAIRKISNAIKRSRTGVTDPNRPIGSFIFLGPTGVGKTELAKVLAREVFGDEKALLKIDMSDFMERHNTSRLVGAPAGYVGYEDGGKLTEAIRRRPYSVVLLDEIEKAHPDVFNMLLQVLEDGQLIDAKGVTINFRNTIIIMTSNLGMAELTRQAVLGFKANTSNEEEQAKQRYEAIKNNITKTLKDQFRPEFLNRLDQVIVFQPLGKAEIDQIVSRELEKLRLRIKELGYSLKVGAKAVRKITTLSHDPDNGARPIRRAIAEHIEVPLANYLLENDLEPGAAITIDTHEHRLTFSKKAKKEKTRTKTKQILATSAA